MTGRVQLALNVDDLAESISFYSKLFGTEPAKVRPGYANFVIADPPLKLILMENRGQGGSLNHLGVEVDDTERGRGRAGPPGRGRPGLGRGARHHLLLRPAGQVLGPGRPERGALGDLHGLGGQRHLLGPGRHPQLGSGRGRARLGPGRSRADRAVLRREQGVRPSHRKPRSSSSARASPAWLPPAPTGSFGHPYRPAVPGQDRFAGRLQHDRHHGRSG